MSVALEKGGSLGLCSWLLITLLHGFSFLSSYSPMCLTKGLAQRKSSESSSLVISLEASLVASVSAEATGFGLTWRSYLCPLMGYTESLWHIDENMCKSQLVHTNMSLSDCANQSLPSS